jgi:hypothetical protein
MVAQSLNSEEIAARGDAIYESRIRAAVEPEHRGQFVIIDIASGDYEVDCDDLTASNRLLVRHPGALLYGVRVGFPAAYRLGCQLLKTPVNHS